MFENTFPIIRYSVSVHLAFDTIYYVESKENVALNKAMLEIEQAGQVLFADAELQPFPFKLHCISQDELLPENLLAKVNDANEADRVEEAIDSLRDCLSAAKGGVLTVRCLPNKEDNVNCDRCDIFTAEGFGDTIPEDAWTTVKSFAHYAALENFQRLAGTSYDCFLEAKEEQLHPHRHFEDSDTMGFVVVPPDPQNIIREMNQRLKELKTTINEQTEYNDIIEVFKNDLRSLENKVKYNEPCPLKVNWKGEIYVEVQGKWEVVTFRRANVADALYIFFLRQIERAAQNKNVSPYLSQVEIQRYKDELAKIYDITGNKKNANIDSWFWNTSGPNDFTNAIGSIRKFFKKEFDVETLYNNHGKCYSIEIMGGKDNLGNPRYGIHLDPNDFDLGVFSIYKYLI